MTNMNVAFTYKDKELMRANSISDMSKTGVCNGGLVTTSEKHTKLERVQKAATRMVSNLKLLTYEERLKTLRFTMLKEQNLISTIRGKKVLGWVDREDLLVKTAN